MKVSPPEANVQTTTHELESLPNESIDNTVLEDPFKRFSNSRKHVITAILSVTGFLAPMSSTAVLSALPEVSETYHTTGDVLGLSNSAYLLAMAVAPLFWGPIGQMYGRRWVMISCAFLYCIFSIGTALAPELVSFYVFRMLTAFEGTSFLTIGASCLGDIFHPQDRATALGWFLSGTTIAPAFAPFISGVIVTYSQWRVIFWLQAAMGGLSTILMFFFLPETNFQALKTPPTTIKAHIRAVSIAINPIRILQMYYHYPGLLLVCIASAATVWNMYTILTPIRYVINPRFHLTSPLQSGLIYLVPGIGNMVGTFFGGRWADRYVRIWTLKKGRRVAEDRLRSCLWSLGLIIPACLLIYGWTITKQVGGLAIPLIAMFVQGFFQMFCIPCINTYCLDVLQAEGRGADAVSCNYLLRYIVGAVGTGVVIPICNGIGIGWFCVITDAVLVICTLLLIVTIKKGEEWRLKRLDSEKK